MAVNVTGCEHPKPDLQPPPVLLQGQGVNQLRFLRLNARWKAGELLQPQSRSAAIPSRRCMFRQGAEVRACSATCTLSAERPTCKLSQPTSHCTFTCFAAGGLKLTSHASAVPNLRPRSCLAALFPLIKLKSEYTSRIHLLCGPLYFGCEPVMIAFANEALTHLSLPGADNDGSHNHCWFLIWTSC